MKKVLGIVFMSFLVLIVIINFCITLKISFFGYRIYRFSSYSMKPTIKYNDFILVKENASFKENDIVTFEINDNLYTHRVVKIDGDEVITKGDANDFNNDPINKDKVINKMVTKLSVLTFINYFFFKPIFWVVFLLILVGTFFIKTRRK